MPRQPRLDAPGALHHVMGRGIDGVKIIGQILEHLAAGSESLWLGEASGYRGLPGVRPAKKSLIKMAIVYEPFKPALNLIQ